jgi:hypothetical protein
VVLADHESYTLDKVMIDVRDRVCHKKTSDLVVAWAEGDFVGWVGDVVGMEGKID